MQAFLAVSEDSPARDSPSSAPKSVARKRSPHLIANQGGNYASTSQAYNINNSNRRKSSRIIDTADRKDLSPEDKHTLLTIEKAIDSQNLAALRKIKETVILASNAEIRSDYVDALGWFGKQTITDLLPFMADADTDIAERATDNWAMAVSEVEDEDIKCQLVETSMKAVRDNGALERIIMELSDIDDFKAVQTLVNVIESEESSTAAIDTAKEQYEFITDSAYKDFETATRWVEEHCLDQEDTQTEQKGENYEMEATY